uniref:Uncharacterized protein n=1 Tax=Anguilla anguilla TaxID=7936 RepID=A0A0E9VXE4_ANGAN
MIKTLEEQGASFSLARKSLPSCRGLTMLLFFW